MSAIQIILLTTGGVLAVLQYVKKSRYDRIKESPIVNLRIEYRSVEASDLLDRAFHFKFIDLSKPQDDELYRYKSNGPLSVGQSCRAIILFSSNSMPAFNTWISLTKDPADIKELAAIQSHYSVVAESAGSRPESVITLILEADFQELVGSNLYVRYENMFREKFYDEFKISQNGKIKKVDTYRIFERLGGVLIYRRKLRM